MPAGLPSSQAPWRIRGRCSSRPLGEAGARRSDEADRWAVCIARADADGVLSRTNRLGRHGSLRALASDIEAFPLRLKLGREYSFMVAVIIGIEQVFVSLAAAVMLLGQRRLDLLRIEPLLLEQRIQLRLHPLGAVGRLAGSLVDEIGAGDRERG